MLESIKTILDVARLIAGVVWKLQGQRKERRQQVADYFDQIAAAMAACGKDFRKGVTRDELATYCGQLQAFAERLPETIGDLLGEEKARELKQKLLDINQGKLQGMTGASPEALYHLAALSKAAGYFSAYADTLRAAP
jgi:hypothetical protein